MTEKTKIINNSVNKPTELFNADITATLSTRVSSTGPIEKNGFRSCGSSERNLHSASKNN